MAIFILMIIDYILTYYGIHVAKVISEGNPLMVFSFNNGFIFGLLFRISYSMIIAALLYRIRKGNVYEYIWTNIAMGAVYLYVFNLHFQWIANTITFF